MWINLWKNLWKTPGGFVYQTDRLCTENLGALSTRLQNVGFFHGDFRVRLQNVEFFRTHFKKNVHMLGFGLHPPL